MNILAIESSCDDAHTRRRLVWGPGELFDVLSVGNEFPQPPRCCALAALVAVPSQGGTRRPSQPESKGSS